MEDALGQCPETRKKRYKQPIYFKLQDPHADAVHFTVLISCTTYPEPLQLGDAQM